MFELLSRAWYSCLVVLRLLTKCFSFLQVTAISTKLTLDPVESPWNSSRGFTFNKGYARMCKYSASFDDIVVDGLFFSAMQRDLGL